MKKGYFDALKHEYVIQDMHPIRPLKNYLWNDKVVANYNQFGFGNALANVPTGFKSITFEERLVYIKDLDTHEYYAMNRNYDNLPFDIFECHVGLGYQRIVALYQGVKSEYTILIPEDDYCELSSIHLENLSSQEKDLHVYAYIKPHINVTWHTAYGEGRYDNKLRGLYYSHVGFDIADPYLHFFMKSDLDCVAFDVSGRFFQGFYNDLAHPLGLQSEYLSSHETTFEDNYVGVMQFVVHLDPHETKDIHISCGIATSYENALILADKYLKKGAFQQELDKQASKAYRMMEAMQIETPDDYLNLQINTWLKRQIALGKTWGRVYGKGFRDVLQDISAFVSLDPTLARERILNTLRYQRVDGNTIRQFDPIVDHPYRDGAAWIPMALLAYLKESGDESILKEEVGYYNSDQHDSVFDHMVRGLDFLLNGRGPHNLVLWGGGDWNDSLNNCGNLGRGESVWLSIATIKALHEFYEIAKRFRPTMNLDGYYQKEKDLVAHINNEGFKGDHYIYGYNDWDEVIGSDETEEGKIYLNPQTWAVLSEVVTDQKANDLMDVVEKRLRCDFGYKQVDPSYSVGTDHIGRASYFKPGTYENGSVYLHGVSFKIAADLKLKRADHAYETLKMIRYDNPLNSDSGMEPYATANMYIGPECQCIKGYAPIPWITGTAGWLYRDITECMLGVQADFDGLRLDPVLPSAWKHVTITRVFRDIKYHITIERTGIECLIVDGNTMKGNLIPLLDIDTIHEVYYSF